MLEIAKIIIKIGIVLTVFGLIIYLAGHFGLFKLPGDIVIRKGNFTFYFPIVSAIIISLILTIILNLIFRK
jgi:hypothetical protein